MEKKRIWCLYRVSGKGQVSVEDDIPIQRNSCLEYIEKRPDWKLTNELYEKGVSGWSKSVKDRNEMNTIREGALHKKFDVLLVYMLDRLGRREDETPLVVQYLIEKGIEVWSVKEGQTKIEHHSDILMNYIHFWQSSGESKKTSIRVREGKKRTSALGYYQGGTVPYGYKVVETDQPHWKNKDKKMKEYVIDENDTGKLMFSGLVFCKYCGKKLIANYRYQKSQSKKTGKITTRIIYRYMCGLYTGRHKHEQSLWSANKYDPIIIKEIKQIFTQIDTKLFFEAFVNQKKNHIIQKERSLSTIKKELNHYKKN